MDCAAVEMASGVPAVCVRRDGVGVVVAAVVPLDVVVLSSTVSAAAFALALSVLAALVSVDVAVPFAAVSAVAFVVAPSSALPALQFEVPVCSCCSAVT